MKVLNYTEAIMLARVLSDKLVSEGKLKDHLQTHGINYHNFLVNVRGTQKKRKNPKIITDFLSSMGYKIAAEKEIIYKFIVDTDPEDKAGIEILLASEFNRQNH